MNVLVTDLSAGERPAPPPAPKAAQPGLERAWRREMERAQLETWFRKDAHTGEHNRDRAPGGAMNETTAPDQAAQSLEREPPQDNAASTPSPSRAASLAPSRRDAKVAAAVHGGTIGNPAPAASAGAGVVHPVAGAAARSGLMPSDKAAAALPIPSQLPGPVPTIANADAGAAPTPVLPAQGAHLPSTAASRPDGTLATHAPSHAPSHAPRHTARTTPSDANPLRVHLHEGPQGLSVWFGIDGDASHIQAQAAALAAALRRSVEGGQRLAQVVCNGRLAYSDPLMANGPFVVSTAPRAGTPTRSTP